MKNLFFILSLVFLLNGCAESIALLGTGATNGRIVQSSFNTAISYGVKKQTGKTPLEHAITYAEKKNPERKQMSLEKTELVEKTSKINKKYAKNNKIDKENSIKDFFQVQKLPRELALSFQAKIKETSLIENIAKNSIIYNRR